MPRIQLSGGAYQARGYAASAQACINLYAEAMPGTEGEPSQFAYYPTPGLVLVHTLSGGGPVRQVYTASSGALYAVGGNTLYRLDNANAATGLSLAETVLTRLDTSSGFVSMADNSLSLLAVDGTGVGYTADLTSNAVTNLTSADNFNGADRVDYIDTFFVLNEPNTPQMYVSGSLATTFDPLDFANKSAASDRLVAAVAARDELWLIGRNTSEPWTDSGASDFPFQKLSGILVEHGCDSVGSIAKADGQIYFVSHDLQGRGIVLKVSGYQATRISTHAIEHQINTYATTADALGYCYQQEGHTFYVLTFPSADVTWVYDEASSQWHQWAWMDGNGALHRHRSNCGTAFAGRNLVGDWQNGNIYALDLDCMTDNGALVQRLRSFPHLIRDGKRVRYLQLSADIECGGAEVALWNEFKWNDGSLWT